MSEHTMKALRRVAIAWLMGASVITAHSFQATPLDADWDWYNRFSKQALDALMPMNPDRILAIYRRSGDTNLDVHEQYFAIRYAHGGVFNRDKLAATIVIPVGQSIQRQLLDLHIKDRQATFESVKNQIRVRRVEVDFATCGAIREQMDALEKLSIGVPPRDLVSADPVLYRIVIGTTALRLDATLMNSAAPIVRWATQTNDSLLACDRR